MRTLAEDLLKTVSEDGGIDDVFRYYLENAVNDLLKIEITEYLGYEKNNVAGYNSGNSRNGFYHRYMDTRFGKIHILVPRDRNGCFKQCLFKQYSRRTVDIEETIIELYKKGITTREISDLVSKIYGHYYTATTISNITKVLQNHVQLFHNRPLSDKYAVIFMDTTFIKLRRACVSAEALHVLLGIAPNGKKEIIDFANFPTESAKHYEEMMQSIKKRGVKSVILFASDGLCGLREAVKRQFPNAVHQQCWAHLLRTIGKFVKQDERKFILNELKNVYKAENKEQAMKKLQIFLLKNTKKYPQIKEIFERTKKSLFSYYIFPKEIRTSIYTTNIIERSNKGLKHKTKVKEQFPNIEALERFVCTFYNDLNKKYENNIHKGFVQTMNEIQQIFKKIETENLGKD